MRTAIQHLGDLFSGSAGSLTCRRLYYNNDVHENERIDVHEQTGIGYFLRDPAIPLSEPACAGERCGFSLGMVNRSVKALQGQGFLTTDMELTEKARLEMAKHRPKNAVILAAGYGMRMVPINMETPKGLLEVEGGTADRAADPSASCGKGEGNLCCRWF